MKKAVLLVLVLAVVAFAAGRGYGGFVLSYMMPDLSALSDTFEAYNLPAIDKNLVTYGGGGWGGTNLVMGGWAFGGTQKFENDNLTVRLTYGGGFFEPGYFINIWKGFGIQPALGIGGTSISMKLRPVLGDIEFDSLLVNPARTSEISYSTFMVAPSLSILIPIEFIAIQLKGGYMWSPLKGEWDLEDGAQVRLGPEIKPSGIFVSAGLLFGGSSGYGLHKKVEQEEQK